MVKISVDLPQPLGPRMATCSPALNAEIHIVQHNTFAARHVHVFQLQKLMFIDRRRARSGLGHSSPTLLD